MGDEDRAAILTPVSLAVGSSSVTGDGDGSVLVAVSSLTLPFSRAGATGAAASMPSDFRISFSATCGEKAGMGSRLGSGAKD